MICVSCYEETCVRALKYSNNIKLAEIRMDMMELSLDDVAEIFSQPIAAIATFRPGTHDEAVRKAYLLAAIDAGAAYVDVEVESGEGYKAEIMERARSRGCKVIISFHDYEMTPDDEALKEIISRCFGEGADIAKIACKANSPSDSARLLGLLGRDDFKGRLVVVGMGEEGRITRIAAPALGSPFTFASCAAGKETAEGQIEAGRLEGIMRLLDGE